MYPIACIYIYIYKIVYFLAEFPSIGQTSITAPRPNFVIFTNQQLMVQPAQSPKPWRLGQLPRLELVQCRNPLCQGKNLTSWWQPTGDPLLTPGQNEPNKKRGSVGYPKIIVSMVKFQKNELHFCGSTWAAGFNATSLPLDVDV